MKPRQCDRDQSILRAIRYMGHARRPDEFYSVRLAWMPEGPTAEVPGHDAQFSGGCNRDTLTAAMRVPAGLYSEIGRWDAKFVLLNHVTVRDLCKFADSALETGYPPVEFQGAKILTTPDLQLLPVGLVAVVFEWSEPTPGELAKHFIIEALKDFARVHPGRNDEGNKLTMPKSLAWTLLREHPDMRGVDGSWQILGFSTLEETLVFGDRLLVE